MAAEPNIKTRCPACGAKYAMPAGSVGHRARCARCSNVFKVTNLLEGSSVVGETITPSSTTTDRSHAGSSTATDSSHAGLNKRQNHAAVPEPHALKRPPTDDDILRWLNEGNEEDEVAARPRILSAGTPPVKKSVASATPRITSPDTPMPADPLTFRKTPTAKEKA